MNLKSLLTPASDARFHFGRKLTNTDVSVLHQASLTLLLCLQCEPGIYNITFVVPTSINVFLLLQASIKLLLCFIFSTSINEFLLEVLHQTALTLLLWFTVSTSIKQCIPSVPGVRGSTPPPPCHPRDCEVLHSPRWDLNIH